MNIRKLPLGEMNLIGARVTHLRLEKKMAQKDLLARLQSVPIEISAPALSLLEGQKRPATDKEIKALADIFGVSADYLLGRTEEKKPLP